MGLMILFMNTKETPSLQYLQNKFDQSFREIWWQTNIYRAGDSGAQLVVMHIEITAASYGHSPAKTQIDLESKDG